MEEYPGVIGYIIGFLVALGIWIYAFSEWGLLLGLVFGWIPALIAGFIAAFIWPLIALIIVVIILIALF